MHMKSKRKDKKINSNKFMLKKDTWKIIGEYSASVLRGRKEKLILFEQDQSSFPWCCLGNLG